MKKLVRSIVVSVVLVSFIFVYGCMGSVPVPVQQYQYGDEKKNCRILADEVSGIDQDIARLEAKRSNKVAANVAIAAVSILILPVGLFLMDSKSDEGLEINALNKRKIALIGIATDQKCEWVLGTSPIVKETTEKAAGNL